MIPPVTSSKVVLVASDREAPLAGPGLTPVRRYRLARLRFDSRASRAEVRFEHLKRVLARGGRSTARAGSAGAVR